MKRYFIYSIILILFAVPIFLLTQNQVMESITQNSDVISKGKNSKEHWIVLANDKRLYIEDFNTWVLIEENQNYTMSYVLLRKTDHYQLITIVPGDYNGQF